MAIALTAGCVTSQTSDYLYACGAGGACPTGDVCAGDNLCHPVYVPDGGAPDAGSFACVDGGGCPTGSACSAQGICVATGSSTTGGSAASTTGTSTSSTGTGTGSSSSGGAATTGTSGSGCTLAQAFSSLTSVPCGGSANSGCAGVAPWSLIDGGPLSIAAASAASASLVINRGTIFNPPVSLPAGTQTTSTVGIAVGDLDGDGVAEIVASTGDAVDSVTSNQLDDVIVWKGFSDGGFGSPLFVSVGPMMSSGVYTPGALSIAPSRGGKPGVVYVEDDATNQISVISITDGGGYQSVAQLSLPASSSGLAAFAIGDVNGDSLTDIVASDYNDEVWVFLAATGTTFQSPVNYPSGSSSLGLALADLDGKNGLDIVAANDVDNTVSVLFNQGAGIYGGRVFFPTNVADAGLGPDGVAVADFDGDGLLDVATIDAAHLSTAGGSFFGSGVSLLPGRSDGGFGPPVVVVSDYDPAWLFAGPLTPGSKPGLVVSFGNAADSSSMDVFFNQCR